jgi:amino acid permease
MPYFKYAFVSPLVGRACVTQYHLEYMTERTAQLIASNSQLQFFCGHKYHNLEQLSY